MATVIPDDTAKDTGVILSTVPALQVLSLYAYGPCGGTCIYLNAQTARNMRDFLNEWLDAQSQDNEVQS